MNNRTGADDGGAIEGSATRHGAWMVGVDTGGTFTDLIAVNRDTQAIHVAKVPSVPADPSVAVINALQELAKNGVPTAERRLLRSRHHRCDQCAHRIQRRRHRPVDHARVSRRLRGARLVAADRQRSDRHLLPQAAAIGAATAHRRSRPSGWITRVRSSRRSTRRSCVPRCAACAIRACRRSRYASCSRSSIPRTSSAPPRSSREEAPGRAASRCRRTSCRVIREYPRLSTTVINAYVGPKIENYLRRLERPAVAGRRRDAAALPDAVERRTDAHFDVGARASRTRHCCRARPPASSPASNWRSATGERQHRHLRHGRHQHRHQRHRRRPDPRDDGRQYRRPGHRHADAEGAHARRRRRHHRLGRQGRSAQSRSAKLRAQIPVRPATAAAAKRRPSPTPMSSLAR